MYSMSKIPFIPGSLEAAELELSRHLPANGLPSLSAEVFLKTLAAIAYLFPELHPDDISDPRAAVAWPDELKPFMMEGWRRVNAGQLQEVDLYQLAAQKAGLVVRRKNPRPRVAGKFLGTFEKFRRAFGTPSETGQKMERN
jgi:hypothetical protein